MISSQRPWPLDHEAGLTVPYNPYEICHTEVSPHRIIIELELQDKRFLRSHCSVKQLDSFSHLYGNRNFIPVLTAAVPLKSQTNPVHIHCLMLHVIIIIPSTSGFPSTLFLSCVPLPICIHFSHLPCVLNFGCCDGVTHNPIKSAHKQVQRMYHTCHICEVIRLCRKEMTRPTFLVTSTN